MKLLREINNEKLSFDIDKQKVRKAARAILFDDDNFVPILFVSKYNYHKIPGGGIDDGEDTSSALKRECLEETGCTIKIEGAVGKIIEYRSKWNMKQISYCYWGNACSKGTPAFTQKEKDDGFQLVWMTLDEAIEQIKKDVPINYEGSFIKERDLTFLQQTKILRNGN